jgi:tRNA threonylcarbamoyladenosine biosynthesis protein TsaE
MIKQEQYICRSMNELPGLAQELIRFCNNEKIILFKGEMGAGKTTFIKSVCDFLQVESVVSSPTFSLVNEYSSSHGVVYHFDFYRLKNEAEALDIGVEEYFYSGNYCLIEWPDKIPSLIPSAYVTVTIELLDDDQRQLTFTR